MSVQSADLTAEEASMMRNAGRKVHIINQTMGGTFFIEGIATIKAAINQKQGRYRVLFDGDNAPVERFVDDLAQANLAEYVARLNDPNMGYE